MVKEALTKIYKVGLRHTLYLQKSLVEDSQFPFKPKEPLIIRIDGNKLVVERQLEGKNRRRVRGN